jgi:hypothetical protein
MEPEGSLLCLQEPACVTFRNKLFFQGEFLAQPGSLKATPYRLSITAYSIYSGLHPQHEDAPCHGDRPNLC